MNRKKLFCLVTALVLALSLLAGCGDGTTTPPAANGGNSPAASGGDGAAVSGDKMFNVALTAPFTGFDPLRTNDSASTYVNRSEEHTSELQSPWN